MIHTLSAAAVSLLAGHKLISQSSLQPAAHLLNSPITAAHTTYTIKHPTSDSHAAVLLHSFALKAGQALIRLTRDQAALHTSPTLDAVVTSTRPGNLALRRMSSAKARLTILRLRVSGRGG